MSEELAGAGITAKERLERIEQAVTAGFEKLDAKLDTKASAADVAAIEIRVRDIELHGSNRVQALERANAETAEVAFKRLDDLAAAIARQQVTMARWAGALAVLIVIGEAIATTIIAK